MEKSDNGVLGSSVVLSGAKDLTPAGDSAFTVRVWPIGEVLRSAQDDKIFPELHLPNFNYQALSSLGGDRWSRSL